MPSQPVPAAEPPSSVTGSLIMRTTSWEVVAGTERAGNIQTLSWRRHWAIERQLLMKWFDLVWLLIHDQPLWQRYFILFLYHFHNSYHLYTLYLIIYFVEACSVLSACLALVLVRHHDPVGPVYQVEHQERQREQLQKDGVYVGHSLASLYFVKILQSLFDLWWRMNPAVLAVDNVERFSETQS